MNLRSLDLNLLVVLDALLAEQHVTRAGKRLGLSQPATSNALERLRRVFEDPLLERVPGGLAPTPRAQALREPLTALLAGVTSLVAGGPIPLEQLEQTVRLSIVDYGVPLLIAPLLGALAQRAPGVDLVCLPWSGADEAHRALEDGSLDLAISVAAPATLRSRPVLREEYVVAMRRRHPASKLTLASWLAYPHVVVSGRGSPSGPLDAVLTERGRRRRVGVVVPSFLAVPSLLASSDLLALVPETLARRSREPIAWTRPPLPVPGFDVELVWHPRRDRDLALAFVRETLAAIAGAVSVTERKPAKRAR
ncbi:MAG: LysR family transcriptional regulator [Polyangiaceae bacterium]